MHTFQELKKAARAFSAPGLKLALCGDTATQLLATALRGTLALRHLGGDLLETDYNQVERQLLAADSELRLSGAEIVIVWEAAERWWQTNESAEARLERVKAYATAFPGKLIYLNCAPVADGVFGSYAATEESFAVRLRRFNAGLDQLAARIPNLFVADLATLVATLGCQNAFSGALYATADMVLTPDAQARLAERLTDIIVALKGKIHKAIILDLDNTLWGGILGEDGMEGIQLGEHGVGKAHTNLQRWLLRLKQRGILLAVCSKNDEALAKEPFERHPEMLLHLDDIACFVANWQTKADNIAYIQQVLNLGFDSFVFLDDNPAERAIVRQAHPDVCVPELPEDPACWLDFLAAENLFETVSYSAEDRARTAQYRTEAQRVAWKATFKDEAEFLQSLEMVATCKSLDAFSIPRAAQLTQRSNQFNLRTRRYTESELLTLAQDPNTITLVFTLADRFGDHGLVSVIIGIKQGSTLFIDTWLMSCRVLKRGLETFALNHLVQAARALGCTQLLGEYIPTPKNGMVATLYPSLGFIPIDATYFTLSLEHFIPKDTPIHD